MMCYYVQKNIATKIGLETDVKLSHIKQHVEVKQYDAVKKAMNSASLKISSLSLQIRLSS